MTESKSLGKKPISSDQVNRPFVLTRYLLKKLKPTLKRSVPIYGSLVWISITRVMRNSGRLLGANSDVPHGAAAEFDYFHFLILSVTLSHPRIAAANALGFSFSHACIAATDTGAVTAALPQCSFVSPLQLPRTYHVSFSSFTAAARPP